VGDGKTEFMKIHAIKRNNNSDEKTIQLYNQLVTVGDLHEFHNQLLKDIKHVLSSTNPVPAKQWLKSGEVKNLLNISLGTLQTLRNNGTLRYNKVGGVIYYEYNDIQNMMSNSA
jgi:hypothetical protein